MSAVGKIAYKYFFKPVLQPLKRLQHDGYFYGRYLLRKGEKEMKLEANSIQFECANSDTNIPFVHYLTGTKYWYQTIFCAYSLHKNTSLPIHFVFHDDGSFDDKFIAQIKMQVKNCTVDTKKDAEKRLDQLLPYNQFPYLRKSREQMPLFYKLMDCKIGYHGWHLLLDSDMLFFNRPIELESWLLNPDANLYMKDKYCSYQYSFELLHTILAKPITGFVNSGIFGTDNSLINWEEMEQWAKQLIDNEGINYFFEQTLHAVYLTKYGGDCPDEKLYYILPTKEEVINSNGTLQHYPTDARQWYFRYGWRKILDKTL